MKRWAMIDGNIIEKTWADNPDGEHLGNLIQRLREEDSLLPLAQSLQRDSQLDIKVHDIYSTDVRGSTLFEFAEITRQSRWVEKWFTSEMLATPPRLTCYRTYDNALLLDLTLRIGRRGGGQLLLFWQIQHLNADSGDLSEVIQRMQDKDLVNILIERAPTD